MLFSQWDVQSIPPHPWTWASHRTYLIIRIYWKGFLKFWNQVTRSLAGSSQASWNAHSWIPELPCKKLDYPAGVNTRRDPESAWRGGKTQLSLPTSCSQQRIKHGSSTQGPLSAEGHWEMTPVNATSNRINHPCSVWILDLKGLFWFFFFGQGRGRERGRTNLKQVLCSV